MKEGWEVRRFEDCIQKVVYSRKIQKQDFLESGDFPVISQEAESVNGYWDDPSDLFRVTNPVVLFGDHTKVIKYVDFDFVLGADGVKILQPIGGIVARFLYYQLKSANLPSYGYARHYRALRELNLVVPPLSEQHRIVEILDNAFADIAKAKANAEQNLRNARELFESQLQSIFTHLGRDCVERKMEDLIESSLIGLTRSSKEQSDDKQFPYVKMNHITRENRFEFTDYVNVDATYEEAERFALHDGDFLFNTRNSRELVGKSCIYTPMVDGMIVYNNNIMRIRFKQGINARFVLAAFASRRVASDLEGLKSGTTNVSAIYYKNLRNLRIPLPPTSQQDSIAVKLDALSAETQRLAGVYERKLEELEALKKSILHKAFSGEL